MIRDPLANRKCGKCYGTGRIWKRQALNPPVKVKTAVEGYKHKIKLEFRIFTEIIDCPCKLPRNRRRRKKSRR